MSKIVFPRNGNSVSTRDVNVNSVKGIAFRSSWWRSGATFGAWCSGECVAEPGFALEVI